VREMGVIPVFTGTQVVTAHSNVPSVTERAIAVVTPVRKTHLLTAGANWSWQDLRDYVVGQIETRFGPIPRNTNQETGIFKSFYGRWPAGPDLISAADIAQHLYETLGGWWRGSPVRIGRFAKPSDPYCAAIVAEQLRQLRAG
jgi:hypothetical protein